MPDTLITTYLEMTDRAAFRPGFSVDPALRIMEAAVPQVAFYRYLYRTVGAAWSWRDRLAWHDDQLAAWLARPEVSVDVLYLRGTPAGYIELDRQGTDSEVAYFGLMMPYIGRGYGKHLLSHGIARAWDEGAARVWVHTCNLDGPHAIANYQGRGFHVYDVKEEAMPGANG